MDDEQISDDYLDIAGLDLHEVSVYLNEDNMSASVKLGKSDEPYTYEEIMAALTAKGIKTGIDENKIRAMISEGASDYVAVASGKRVKDGDDGYYEFFFDTDRINENKPTVREDGSVDYFNLKHFEKVDEGDLLARYHEPTKGEFGFDVCGKLLVPKPGRNMPHMHGKNFKTSEDGLEIYAAISGKVEYFNYDLNVINVYEISGDLDLSMGNIDFNGDVSISGGIGGGVTVRAMGNIFVGGFIESATLISGKDIVLKEGMNAKNSGRVQAEGNISGRFFENVDLFAKGDIKCNYILNSNVLAYGKVYVEGQRGSIIGGETTAVMGVLADNCGSENNAKTSIRAGSTKKIRRDYAELIIKLKEVDTQLDTFEKAIRKFDYIRFAMPDKYDPDMARKVMQSKIIKKAEKAKLEEQSTQLYNLIKDSENSVVKISNVIYPGCKVCMDDKMYIPNTAYVHVLIKRTPSAIVIRDYNDYEEDEDKRE